MRPFRFKAAACAICLTAAGAFAQESASPEQGSAEATALEGVEAPDAAEGEPTIEESAILPSADEHEASRAPSMALDCERAPEDCVEPLDGSSEGPLQTSPDDPATPQNESARGEEVTTEP